MVADGVALLGGQVLEYVDLADIRLGHLVVVLHHLPLDPQEDVLAQTPEHTTFRGSD